MKKLIILTPFLASLCLAFTNPLSAQAPSRPTPTPPATPAPATPTPRQDVSVGPQSGMLESNTALEFSDRVFDTNSDSIDFANGGFQWKGKTFSIENSRVFKARFDRYLNTPTTRDDEAYQELIAEVMQRLSVNNTGDLTDEILEAWSLLFQAGEYQADGSNSIIIANTVNNSWRIRAETRGSQAAQQELDKLEKYQASVVANRVKFLELEHDRIQKLKAEKRHTGKDYKAKDGLSTEPQMRALELAETTAKITALQAQSFSSGIQAKLQFQSQIVNFFVQRRFQHCIIACGFYRHIFKGSAQNLEVGKKQIADFFPNADFIPTVESIESLANEANDDVRKSMEAIDTAYQLGHMITALKRMQEAFFLGEHHSDILTYPFENKQQLFTLYKDMETAQQLADLKDYQGIEDIVKEASTYAKDLPERQIMASISSGKRASNIALLTAQQAIMTGDTERGKAYLERSIELWPLNPAINQFTQQMTDRVSLKTQATKSFDELLEQKNYREIYNRGLEYGIAFTEDPERAPQLKEIMTRIAKVDGLIAQSEEMIAQSLAFSAWELLSRAAEYDPEDPKLNRAQAKLAPRVATFVKKLDTAKRASENQEWALALIKYMAAQDEHPISRICRIGIEQSSAALMENL